MIPLYHDGIPTTSGIYRITCIVTGKIYIGSALNLRNRWRRHRNALLRNGHHNPKLQRAWNKYSPDAFTFEVLELVLPISLTAREQYWFKKLKPFGKRGFNIYRVAGSSLGYKPSQATCDKIRVALSGRKGQRCAEFIEKGRIARLGQKPSPTSIDKMRNAKKDKMKTLLITAPDGAEYAVVGIRQFCKEHQLDRSTLMRVVKGRSPHYKGWKARFP